MKEFTTAVERVEKKDDDGLEFTYDKRLMRVYPPQEGQWAILLASIGRGASEMERISGVINFFMKIMDAESAFYFENRLLDREDPFSIADVEKIITWLTEEWSGHPTQSPSDLPQSQPDGGQKSTPNTLLLT